MFHVEHFLKEFIPWLDVELCVRRFIFIKEAYFKWNKVINISSIRDEQGFWEKHVLDSLCLARFIGRNNYNSYEILDIGSGGGFPGLILASCLNNKISLVEPIAKKLDFSKHIILRLGLNNTKTILGLYQNINSLDNKTLIVSRALGAYNELYSHFKNISDDAMFLIMATEKQSLGFSYSVYDEDYNVLKELLGKNILPGHLIMKAD